MPGSVDDLDLIRRIQGGDQDAATELVRRCEPFLHRIARVRMRQRGDFESLHRDVSSVDIVQSVFKSFFEKVSQNGFELNDPDHLVRLLTAMTRLKISTKARRADVKWRTILGETASQDVVDHGRGPEAPVDDKDLSDAVLRQFSLEEMEILNNRIDDHDWSRIAQKMGGTPEGRRKQLARAIDRVRESSVVKDALPA